MYAVSNQFMAYVFTRPQPFGFLSVGPSKNCLKLQTFIRNFFSINQLVLRGSADENPELKTDENAGSWIYV
jgi:hypothetical protein